MFPTQVQDQPAIGIEGDFANLNPRSTVPTQAGGMVAGVGGLIIGRFGWVGSDGISVTNAGSGVPDGFVHRDLSGLITVYLQETGFTIPAGFPVVLFDGGDFLVRNTGAGAVTRRMKAYASNTTGLVQFAATGQTIAGFTETAWSAAIACAVSELTTITKILG